MYLKHLIGVITCGESPLKVYYLGMCPLFFKGSASIIKRSTISVSSAIQVYTGKLVVSVFFLLKKYEKYYE